MINIENLTYSKSYKIILDNINLVIKKGTITFFEGKNGAGKSTLMECIAGIRKPTEGTVKIAGFTKKENPERYNKKIGFLPTFYGLYDSLTVKQNLIYFAHTQGFPLNNINNKVEETAERFLLTEYISTKVKILSRGYRQRLALARAIIHEPEVLLLEKPMATLDKEMQNRLKQILEEQNKKGNTIIISSQAPEKIKELKKDIVKLENGKIIKIEN